MKNLNALIKKISPIFFTIFLLLNSCISEREKNAAANAAAISGAEDYTIAHSTLEGGDKKEHKALVITLKHITSTEKDEKLAATSALTVFGMITKEDYEDYDQIKIVVNRTDPPFEKVYDIKKLEIAKPLLTDLLNIFKQDENNNYNIPKEMIDPQLLKDSTILQFKNILYRLDGNYGQLSNVAISGFSFDPIKAMEDDNIMAAWVTAKNGAMLTSYTFYFSLEAKKIIYIGINQEE